MRSVGEADLLVVGGNITTAGTPDDVGRAANPGPAAAGHYAIVEVGETVSVRLDDPPAP